MFFTSTNNFANKPTKMMGKGTTNDDDDEGGNGYFPVIGDDDNGGGDRDEDGRKKKEEEAVKEKRLIQKVGPFGRKGTNQLLPSKVSIRNQNVDIYSWGPKGVHLPR